MKTLFRTIPALMLAASCAQAQEKPAAEGAAKAPAAERPAETKAFDRTLKAESSVSKSSTVTIRGISFTYKVTAVTQTVWDMVCNVFASLF